MMFTISRASTGFFSDRQPCADAMSLPMVKYTYFTFRSLEEAEAKHPGHKFEKTRAGFRAVRATEREWWIDVSDLDELMAMYGAIGSLIIEPHWEDHEQPHIVIYDDYVE